jgi:hypothetical protein
MYLRIAAFCVVVFTLAPCACRCARQFVGKYLRRLLRRSLSERALAQFATPADREARTTSDFYAGLQLALLGNGYL